MHYIPSYEQCLEIVAKNEVFTHRYRDVDGEKVSMFDYLLATYPDFKTPIKDSDIKAFELRGLCFTHNPDGSVHRRYLLLHKFFNLNQCADYQYDDVKHKKVIRVMDKMDGSVIRFIELANGKIVAKSKTFFDNDQTTMATEVYKKNKELQSFVKDTLDSGLCAIFELTSPSNRIVIPYSTTQLTLLQLRDEETGEYLDIYNHPLVKKHNVKLVRQESELNLEHYIAQQATKEDVEGWIVMLEDGSLLKLKTVWYCNLHGILTDKLSKENHLMEMILNSTIDDALAQLDPLDERKAVIEELCQRVNHFMVKELAVVYEVMDFYKLIIKKSPWAMTLIRHRHLGIASFLASNPTKANDEYVLKYLTEEWLSANYRLFESKRWLKENLGFELSIKFSDGDDN